MKIKLRVVQGGNSEEKKKKKSSSEKPPSVVGIIDQYAADMRKPYEGFFRPSMLFSCDRANVFHYQMIRPEPQQHDARLVRILDNGTAVHEVIQDKYLSNNPNYWFVKEPKVVIRINGALVKGSCDGVLIRRSDMYRWGIEIKTIGHEEFMRLVKPKEEHVQQARIYMELQDLPYITIIYWDKDKQHLKEFHVKRDRKEWEEIEERVGYLYSFIERDKLPKYDKAMCNKSFCRHVKHCRRMGAPV